MTTLETTYQTYKDERIAASIEPLSFTEWLTEYEKELNEQLNVLSNRRPMLFRQHAHEILDACIDAQNEGKATIFCEIYGHVQMINVRIYAPFWVSGTDPSFALNIYDSTAEINASNKTKVLDYLNSL